MSKTLRLLKEAGAKKENVLEAIAKAPEAQPVILDKPVLSARPEVHLFQQIGFWAKSITVVVFTSSVLVLTYYTVMAVRESVLT